jgi:hypothetical protein
MRDVALEVPAQGALMLQWTAESIDHLDSLAFVRCLHGAFVKTRHTSQGSALHCTEQKRVQVQRSAAVARPSSGVIDQNWPPLGRFREGDFVREVGVKAVK